MIEIKTVDLEGFNQFVGGFQRAVQISSQDAVNYQTGRIMDRIAKELPPKTKAKAQKKAAWQVRKSFYAVKRGSDVYDLSGNKPLFKGKQSKGDGMTWLYASPIVIVGTPKKYDKTGVSAAQMMLMHKREQSRAESNRWQEAGKRGKQRIMLVNKPVVRATQARAFVRQVRDSFGKLKASFLKGMRSVGRVKIDVPSIAAKHLQDSKGMFVPVRPNDVSPATIIISQSPGCEHPNALKTIKGVVIRQLFAMKKDMELYFAGTKKAADFRKKNGFKKFVGMN